MISKKINVMGSFNNFSYRLTSFRLFVMKKKLFFHSNLKVILVVAASLACFAFLLGLSGLDDSVIFNPLKKSHASCT